MVKRYNVIYADPPWSPSNKNTGGSLSSGSANQYDVMTVDDIAALNVQSICEKDCWLFMWWLASMPKEALRVVSQWGFTLKTLTCFSWIKKTSEDKDHFGMGFYTRQQQEHCLIAKRGKPDVASHSVRQNIRAKVGRHSEKPRIVRERIVELVGDIPRIELFARDRVENWDCWGKEVENDVEIKMFQSDMLAKLRAYDFEKIRNGAK